MRYKPVIEDHDRCPLGLRRRYTNGGPPRCAGGLTEAKCRCQPPGFAFKATTYCIVVIAPAIAVALVLWMLWLIR